MIANVECSFRGNDQKILCAIDGVSFSEERLPSCVGG